MQTKPVRIVDYGRGPQIEDHRITVMDVFYWLHRGYDFDFIHDQVMPSLRREEFDAVADYVKEHHDQLVEWDREADERTRRAIEEQKAKGLYHEIDESVPFEVRMQRLKDKLHERMKRDAERNGGHPPR